MNAPPIEPLAVGIVEASKLISVSSRTLWTILKSGDGPPTVKILRRTVFPVRELQDWLSRRAEVRT